MPSAKMVAQNPGGSFNSLSSVHAVLAALEPEVELSEFELYCRAVTGPTTENAMTATRKKTRIPKPTDRMKFSLDVDETKRKRAAKRKPVPDHVLLTTRTLPFSPRRLKHTIS